MSKRARPETQVNRLIPRAKRARIDPVARLETALRLGEKGGCLVAIPADARNHIWLALDMRGRVQLARTCRGLHIEQRQSAWFKALRAIGLRDCDPRYHVDGLVDRVSACAALAIPMDITLSFKWAPYPLDGHALIYMCDIKVEWAANGFPVYRKDWPVAIRAQFYNKLLPARFLVTGHTPCPRYGCNSPSCTRVATLERDVLKCSEWLKSVLASRRDFVALVEALPSVER